MEFRRNIYERLTNDETTTIMKNTIFALRAIDTNDDDDDRTPFVEYFTTIAKLNAFRNARPNVETIEITLHELDPD